MLNPYISHSKRQDGIFDTTVTIKTKDQKTALAFLHLCVEFINANDKPEATTEAQS